MLELNASRAVLVSLALLTACGTASDEQAGSAPPSVAASTTAPTASPSPSSDDPCAGLPLDEADLCYAEAGGGEGSDEFGSDSGGQTDLSAQETADLGLGLTLTELVVRPGSEDGQLSPNDPEHADETFFHLEATVRNDSTQAIDLSGVDAFNAPLGVLYGVNEYEAQSWATAGANDLPRRIAPGTEVVFVQDISMRTPVEKPIVVVFDGAALGSAEHRIVGVDDLFTV